MEQPPISGGGGTATLVVMPVRACPKDFPAYCEELQGNAGRYICALLLNNKYDRRPIDTREVAQP